MRDLSLLLLRLTFGGLMIINHGYPKLMKAMNENPIKFPDPLGVGADAALYLAVFSELGCAVLLVLGLFTPRVGRDSGNLVHPFMRVTN